MPTIEALAALAPAQFHLVTSKNRLCWISGWAIEILWCTACKVDLCLHLTYSRHRHCRTRAVCMHHASCCSFSFVPLVPLSSPRVLLCLDFRICRQYLGSQAELHSASPKLQFSIVAWYYLQSSGGVWRSLEKEILGLERWPTSRHMQNTTGF